MKIDYQDYWEKYSFSYEEYNEIIDKQVIDGETSGLMQNDALANFTKLNDSRMQRLDKKLEISKSNIDKLIGEKRMQHWLVITETWCGDAAQILPVVNKINLLVNTIEVRYIWRDQFPDLINEHLTNGAKSIPMVIFLNKEYELSGEWGPRPKIAQQMVLKNKEIMGKIEDVTLRNAHYQKFQIDLQKWYNKNKGVDIQNELVYQATINH